MIQSEDVPGTVPLHDRPGYYVLMKLATRKGFQEVGRLFLAEDRETAFEIFCSFEAHGEDRGRIQLELVRLLHGILYKPIATRKCTATCLASNVSQALKAAFCSLNLSAGRT